MLKCNHLKAMILTDVVGGLHEDLWLVGHLREEEGVLLEGEEQRAGHLQPRGRAQVPPRQPVPRVQQVARRPHDVQQNLIYFLHQ